MARLAVLTDRLPNDPSWKGAYTWEIIRALSESQHEVAVFTTADPEQVTLTHSRLTVARPAPSWSVDRMARWAQALLNYRPEVIHTFALQESGLWPSLTIWPYLDALCRVLPDVVRVSTMFEPADFTSGRAATWHAGSHSWTVFSEAHAEAARHGFAGRTEVAPIDSIFEERSPALPDDGTDENGGSASTFVPAPVSDWSDPFQGLARLGDYLQAHPQTTLWINGGWGELSLRDRREGWRTLMPVADRVRLIENQPLEAFIGRVRQAEKIWIEGLKEDSWRYLMSVQVGHQLGKELIGRTGRSSLPTATGSTANFLSRIYLS